MSTAELKLNLINQILIVLSFSWRINIKCLCKLNFEIEFVLELDYLLNKTNSFATTSVI